MEHEELVHEVVSFCCPGCKKSFDKDPGKYTKYSRSPCPYTLRLYKVVERLQPGWG